MRILIANDDGIYSPGLLALAEVAREFGQVRIVAPDVEQSSMGHAISAHTPLRYRPTAIGDFEAYRVNGTPADCVALGLFHWEQQVDIVLSGINLGTNLGNSAWHSGTLAAAKQAVLFGFRGIAFSTPVSREEPDFSAIKPHVRECLELLLPQKDLSLINVNIPRNAKGLRWVRQSLRHYDGKVVPGTDPMGRQHYWFTVVPVEITEENTDRWAVENGWVSLTPLRLDLTHEEELERALKRAKS
ncbi:5'/3'-nucleotidase SurE [Cesiribacter andamanensis]|uniref:5'-nucleotidase SurE n=1 Tax=Cesiribacter andamanensis AMV16 TaxID=1279009 RepID=M7N7U1_9BACT|nr:5'/3'-nucleotidase SurE [Cesiribacter andamanensis]EMR03312.1 5'-nucleotidase surE [Cesiribacter andamanensis AMV16]